MTKETKNESLLWKIVMVSVIAAFGLLMVSPWEDHSTNAAELETSAAVEVPAKPVFQQDIDEDANYIWMTRERTEVYSQPGGILLGTLDSGISITVRPTSETITEDSWGWVREFHGWCKLNTLERVPVNDVVGVAYMKMDTNPSYHEEPNETSEAVEITGYSAYEILPNVYEGKYLKIGDNAYIDKKHVIVDYYQRQYYQRAVAHPVSRGYVDRYRTPFNKNISDEITMRSGLTAVELDRLTEGTGLEGLGESLRHIEDRNGVNAVFALSVAQLESGYGSSYMAQVDNNIFGMTGMEFESKDECVKYFGNLIQHWYFNRGLDTVETINDVYCPPNPNWSVQVSNLMDKNFSQVRTSY